MLGRQTLRGLERPTAGWLSDVALIKLRGVGARRTQGIAPQLPGRIRCRSDPKRRLHPLPQRLIAGVGGQLEQSPHLRLSHGRAGRVESLEIGSLIATVEPVPA